MIFIFRALVKLQRSSVRELSSSITLRSKKLVINNSYTRAAEKVAVAMSREQGNEVQRGYPGARRDETVIDDYHGTEICDPYRWLEDPDSPETTEFIKEQNSVTMEYIEKCAIRSDINRRLTGLWNYPKYSPPFRHGNYYFFYHNTGLQNQSVLYLQKTLDSEPIIFLDPNELSSDGTVAFSGTAFSEDGKTFAYGLSQSGSDWIEIHFKDVETGVKKPEVLKNVKFTSLSWTHDNKGIFYGRYPEASGKADGSETTANLYQKLYYHRLDTPQSEDVLVVQFPDDPLFRIGSHVSDCGKYLVLTTQKDCRDNLVFFADLSTLPNGEITGLLNLIPVVTKLEADYEYVTNEGTQIIFRTNKGAPNYRLIGIDFNDYSEDNWTTLIAQHEKDVLDWATPVDNDKLVVGYIHDVASVLKLHDLKTGNVLKVFSLDLGTIVSFSGEKKLSEIFYQFTSFLTPGIIYRYDLQKPDSEPTVHREIKVADVKADNYQTKQVFYESTDGTRVPMFIVHRKDIVADGKNPCLLYGYGGFNISIQPTFSVSRLVFIHNFKGVLAIPNIRGGGEYGEKWHNAGRLFNKQNVFEDFQCAAKYLIQAKLTEPRLLTIQGGSNGGLLVAACANQRPDLFGTVIAQVGVFDMLRFHKFTIGSAWKSDYGSSDDKLQFETLLKYSPLHNVVPPSNDGVNYPAILLFTADHDDRVVPLHSFKLIAELQYRLGKLPFKNNHLMIRVDTKAGHGGGKPTAKMIEEVTDMYCFIVQTQSLEFSH